MGTRSAGVWRDVAANILLLGWFLGLALLLLAGLEGMSFDGGNSADPVAGGTGWGIMVAAPVAAWLLTALRGARVVAVVEMGLTGLLVGTLLVGVIGDAT